MSKIGKKPITIKDNVTVTLNDGVFVVKGPKGEVSIKQLEFLNIDIQEKEILITLTKNIKQGRSNWGTQRSLLNSAIVGVVDGFEKKLEINGVGFKVAVEGKILVLNVGFSHQVKFPIPEGIEINVVKNLMTITGFNKDLVGRTAAEIRAIKKPEPYKGKGIKYVDEIIIRKAGKKAGAAA